jgi:hypothetical protein
VPADFVGKRASRQASRMRQASLTAGQNKTNERGDRVAQGKPNVYPAGGFLAGKLATLLSAFHSGLRESARLPMASLPLGSLADEVSLPLRYNSSVLS